MAHDNYYYLRYSITFLKLAGIYPPQTKSRFKIWLLYFWRAMVNLALLLMITLNSINVAKKWSFDFTSAVESIVFIGVSLVMVTRKNYLITFGAKGLRTIDEMLALFKQETRTGLKAEKSLRTYIRMAEKITIFWAVMATLTSQCLLLARLIFNRGQERIFPLPLWFPEEWKASPYYELTLVYQSFAFQMMTIVAVGIDSFFVSTIIYVCAQFDMLGWECKCLLYKGLKLEREELPVRIVEDEVILDETVSLQLLDEMLASKGVRAYMLKSLNEMAAFHQFLLGFCERLDEIFAPIFLSYFLIITITLVFITYTLITNRVGFFYSRRFVFFSKRFLQLPPHGSSRPEEVVCKKNETSAIEEFKETSDLTRLSAFVSYFVSTAFTLFLPCYFGNLLNTQAEKFFQDLYFSSWYVCNEAFKMNFRQMQVRACRPLTLSIGKFGELSLSVFLSVMQSTVSYALVLRHLTEENS